MAPNGIIHPHVGWIAAALPPTRSASGSRWGVSYADSTVFAKQALKTMLETKYTTIAAMNASWGSNYTSFGSAGGWPKRTTGGTGFLDEDGSSAWLGSTNGNLVNGS